MAKLNKSLIRSMVWDLKEVVNLSIELSSWMGKIDCMSWRYPTRQSQAVDLLSIFKNLNGSAGEFYIYLLEFIYDRLLLVLNLLIKYLDNFPIATADFKMAKNVIRPQHLSLGGLLNMFWTRMQTLQKSALLCMAPHRPGDYLEMSSVNCAINSDRINRNISHTVVSRSCQTDLISLASCENCHICNELMRQLIKEIENTSLDVNGTSSVAIQRELMTEKILNTTQWSSMADWARVIVEDFNNLAASFKKTNETNKKLAKAISINGAQIEAKCHSYQESIKDLKIQSRKLQEHLVKKEIELTHRNEQIKELQLKITESDKTYKILEIKFKLTETMLTESEAKKKSVELTLKELQLQLDSVATDYKRLADEMETLNGQRQQERRDARQADHKMLEVNRKVQVAQALFHEQTVQMERTHEKEKECILAEMNGYKNDAEVQSNLRLQLQSENSSLKADIVGMETTVSMLEKQVSDLRRRESTLVRFPDVICPSIARMEGDPAKDMLGQLRANEIRIQLLQADNDKLALTLDKLHRHAASKDSVGPGSAC